MSYIERKAVEKIIKQLYQEPKYQHTEEDFYDGVCAVAGGLATLPTADVAEVKHGVWVHCDGKSNLWHCSECGDKILYNPTRKTYNIRKRPVNEVNKYCRCCGAKMDGENKTYARQRKILQRLP